MANYQLLINNYQLPEGYKQTEVGVIPEDWDVVTIQDLTSLVTNGFVGKATIHYTDQDDGITYIQGYNVEANSFNFNGIKKVTSEFHKIHQKSCLKKNDLLTVQTGEVGLTTIVPKELEGSNCHALIISRFKKDKAVPLFYAYYFNSSIGRLRLKDLEVGTTMKHINVADLLVWEVPYLPNKEEQRTIAQTLSDVDALIASLDKLIAKQRHLKTATMQQLLTGKKRLPGFGKAINNEQLTIDNDGDSATSEDNCQLSINNYELPKGYQQTEVGVIPEDWEVRELESLGTGTIPSIKAGPFGSALTKDTYVPMGYKVYGQEQVIRGDHLYGNYFISIDKFRQLESCAVRPGDILLSLVGTAGKVLVVPENAPPGIINPRLIVTSQ